jgi:hypothetical protein
MAITNEFTGELYNQDQDPIGSCFPTNPINIHSAMRVMGIIIIRLSIRFCTNPNEVYSNTSQALIDILMVQCNNLLNLISIIY